MHITKDQVIAGQPALKVRSFVRTYRILSFYTSELEKVLNLSPAEAEDLAREMVNLGFFTQTTYCPINNRPVYQVGDQGHMLANASAAKPITRKTADRVLQEFMERVRIVNASTLYAYKVETTVLFGSMLSDKEPGVIKICHQPTRWRRGYTSMRIPERIVQRVHRRLQGLS